MFHPTVTRKTLIFIILFMICNNVTLNIIKNKKWLFYVFYVCLMRLYALYTRVCARCYMAMLQGGD